MRLERGEKQGNWEGEAPAESKRQRIATGDWRMVNDFSGGQCSRTAERISLHQGVVWRVGLLPD
jgi:hypothetical protein